MRSSALALRAGEYDLNGKLLFTWGTWGTLPGAFRACISSPSIPTAIYMRPRLTAGGHRSSSRNRAPISRD
jgi:hypothetical protein